MVRFFGIFGSVIFIFGLLGGLIIASFSNLLVLGHVVIGTLLMLAWAFSRGTEVFGDATQVIKGRTTRYGSNAVIYTVVVIGIIVALNWIIARHDKRWDLTEQKVYSLSPQTVAVLENLKTPLKLIAFKDASGESQRLETLLRRYEGAGSNVDAEIVDPRAKPQLIEQYEMKAGNMVYVQLGEGEQMSVSRINEGTEEAITNAIVKLTKGAAKKIYFVQGHDEPGIDDAQPAGINQLVLALRDEHFTVEPLVVGTIGAVPTDAAAVVFASPDKPLLAEEKRVLIEYAANGGRLLLLSDPRVPGDMAEIAAHFGIRINNDVVLDQMQRLFAGPAIGAEPIAVTYDQQNPITANLTERNITIYNIASSLSRTAEADNDATYSELVKSSESAWGETNLGALLDSPEPAAERDNADNPGPVNLAMAYEKKLKDKTARVVVFGDADWALNANLRIYANRDLLLNAVNWIAGEDSSVSIRAGSIRSSLQPIPRETVLQILLWSFISPELILLLGLFVWWRRRMLSAA